MSKFQALNFFYNSFKEKIFNIHLIYTKLAMSLMNKSEIHQAMSLK